MDSWLPVQRGSRNRIRDFFERAIVILAAWGMVTAAAFAQPSTPSSPAKPGEIVAQLTREAESMIPQLQGTWTKQWAKCISELPPIEPFQIRMGDRERLVDESLYYQGRYGSPLSYSRAFDLAESAGLKLSQDSKVFDFGYGTIGQLKMLAAMGIDVVAADVDPILPLLYQTNQQPPGQGSILLLDGQFPTDEKLTEQAGDQFDLFISKNTLKKGYIHPTREVTNPRQLINLGVDDARFLSEIHRILKPNGYLVIYNLCPAKAKPDEPYIPWADGECPFTREQLETAGFEILSLDQIDDPGARQMGKILGWDANGGMNLNDDLFAWYTIARKKPTTRLR